MRNQELNELFIQQLADIYSAENQIIEALPTIIKQVSLPELKEVLTRSIRENENQVKKIERIFSNLNIESQENNSEAVEGLINQLRQLIQNKSKTPALDAAILISLLKLKHYKLAAYAGLKNLAKHLSLDSQAASLLQETLTEVGTTERNLSKLLENPQLASGLQQRETAEAGTFGKKNRY